MHFEYNNLNNVDIRPMHEARSVKTINKTTVDTTEQCW